MIVHSPMVGERDEPRVVARRGALPGNYPDK